MSLLTIIIVFNSHFIVINISSIVIVISTCQTQVEACHVGGHYGVYVIVCCINCQNLRNVPVGGFKDHLDVGESDCRVEGMEGDGDIVVRHVWKTDVEH